MNSKLFNENKILNANIMFYKKFINYFLLINQTLFEINEKTNKSNENMFLLIKSIFSL